LQHPAKISDPPPLRVTFPAGQTKTGHAGRMFVLHPFYNASL